MLNRLPDERPLHEGIQSVRVLEKRIALYAAVFGFLIGLAGLPLWGCLAGFLINLRPEASSGGIGWKALLIALLMGGVPLVGWLILIVWEHFRKRDRWFCAAASALLLLVVGGALFLHPRVQWFYLEACKIRTESFSFARSSVFWRRNGLDGVPSAARETVVVIGSSQVNFAISEALLSERLPACRISKKTLPGFGVMQYLMVVPELKTQQADTVVCWVSEFDLFREETLPVNRLRGHVSGPQLFQLVQTLSPRIAWDNRSELSDLAAACLSPLWRDRDLLRILSLNFWWRASSSPQGEPPAGDRQRQIANLKQSIRRTRLVQGNFDAFALFARQLRDAGIRLVVFEGQTNPLAVQDVDPAFRVETRTRFEKMAREVGFDYVTEDNMPLFTADDFCDAYHLAPRAAQRFSEYLAGYLRAKTIESLNLKESQ